MPVVVRNGSSRWSSETLCELLPATGSYWLPLIVAVLVWAPALVTLATMLSVAPAPFARLPMVQTPAA